MDSYRHTLQTIWNTFSGEAAWQTVTDLSRYHRIQASPGHRQAAELIHGRLAGAGIDSQILSYPADEETCFWAWPSFQEWDCAEATLTLVEPVEKAGVLADFRACPISVIQRSASFQGEAGVVLLEDGEEEEDYEGVDVAGKVVLSRGDLRRVWELAVEKRGALGILFDGMRPVQPVRPEGDLADVRQYTSFWWQPGDTRCFGFVLTPRQGQALRHTLKKDDGPVRVRANVASRLYDGAFEVVSGTISGDTDEEIVVVAHLCHPRPSANDNASGAAAALEAALTLQSLIVNGELHAPKRTIRFLWLPEMTGTFAYLSGREADLHRLVAGINLDMVGEDQNQTGSSWLIERPPDAMASFAPELLAWLRDQLPGLKGMTGIAASHTGVGGYPLYRHAETPFSGGSDHYILSDPTVGVPAPMLIQWPDRYYHTSADTPDRTDPASLARSGALAAAYAYWLACAETPEANWLGSEMVARFKVLIVRAAQAAVSEAFTLSDAEALVQAMRDVDRRLAYLLDRQKAALSTLKRLAPVDCPVADLHDEAVRLANQELAWVIRTLDLHAAALDLDLPAAPPETTLSPEEQEAAGLRPARLVKGPVPLHQHLTALDPDDREAWRQLLKARKGTAHRTLPILALYWTDAARSVLDIAGLVELETGTRDVELLLAYFRLLAKLDLLELEESN
jgi:hypothetical protein